MINPVMINITIVCKISLITTVSQQKSNQIIPSLNFGIIDYQGMMQDLSQYIFYLNSLRSLLCISHGSHYCDTVNFYFRLSVVIILFSNN